MRPPLASVLLALSSVGDLIAARLLAETGGATRFTCDAAIGSPRRLRADRDLLRALSSAPTLANGAIAN